MFRLVRVSVLTFFVLLIGHMSEAQAFPWKEIAQGWWGGPEGEGRVEISGSYEAGAIYSYFYPKQASHIFRVLYETHDSALILERSIDGPEGRYTISFLCIDRWSKDGKTPYAYNEASDSWFTAGGLAPLQNDNEYYTLTAEQILQRIQSGPWVTQDYLKPIDCKKWYQSNFEKGPRPYFQGYYPPNQISIVGDRTRFPRSGF